jgi:hypothetical protein
VKFIVMELLFAITHKHSQLSVIIWFNQYHINVINTSLISNVVHKLFIPQINNWGSIKMKIIFYFIK